MLSLLFILAVVEPSSPWRDEPDARAILADAAEACRELESISYEMHLFALKNLDDTVMKAQVLQAKATVKEAGFTKGLYRIEGTITQKDREDKEFAASYDGNTFRRIKPGAKEIIRIDEPTVQQVVATGPLEPLSMAFPQFAEAHPFDFEKKPHSILKACEYVGQEDVMGSQCHMIRLTVERDYPGAPNKFTSDILYGFGIEDGLPRLLQTAVQRKTIRIEDVDFEPALEEFTIEEEGYRERPSRPRDQPGAERLLVKGTIAPSWSLIDARTKKVVTSDEFRGKTLVLDFSASWCVPCKRAMPILQGIDDRYKSQNVVVLCLDVLERDQNTLLPYMEENGFRYRLLLEKGSIVNDYGVLGLPSLYVIDPSGKVAFTHYGATEDLEKQLIGALDAILSR